MQDVRCGKDFFIAVKRINWSDDKRKVGKITRNILLESCLDLGFLSTPYAKKIYKLVSVVVHRGTGRTSGHYVAHVLVGQTWYEINDDEVSEINKERVFDSPATLLGYILEGSDPTSAVAAAAVAAAAGAPSAARDSEAARAETVPAVLPAARVAAAEVAATEAAAAVAAAGTVRPDDDEVKAKRRCRRLEEIGRILACRPEETKAVLGFDPWDKSPPGFWSRLGCVYQLVHPQTNEPADQEDASAAMARVVAAAAAVKAAIYREGRDAGGSGNSC